MELYVFCTSKKWLTATLCKFSIVCLKWIALTYSPLKILCMINMYYVCHHIANLQKHSKQSINNDNQQQMY